MKASFYGPPHGPADNYVLTTNLLLCKPLPIALPLPFSSFPTVAQAQRLGRILRAKRAKAGASANPSEFNAFFYTLVCALLKLAIACSVHALSEGQRRYRAPPLCNFQALLVLTCRHYTALRVRGSGSFSSLPSSSFCNVPLRTPPCCPLPGQSRHAGDVLQH
jgi:hypothetical protein